MGVALVLSRHSFDCIANLQIASMAIENHDTAAVCKLSDLRTAKTGKIEYFRLLGTSLKIRALGVLQGRRIDRPSVHRSSYGQAL